LIAECPGCKPWCELHSHLWHELRCKLWQWPCIQRPSARSPYPKGSHADLTWKTDLEAQQRWHHLEAALAAQRKAAPEARRVKAAEQQAPVPAT